MNPTGLQQSHLAPVLIALRLGRRWSSATRRSSRFPAVAPNRLCRDGRTFVHGRTDISMESGHVMDRLLTVDQAGELLNTGPRFVRRLIAEHRIEFVHVGRHVRITESALARFVEAGSVPVMTVPGGQRG
jgi:excisionase family DNA binding protein